MAKPYDRNFKVTGQKDARGHLYVFAGVPLDDSIEVEPVDKDLSVPGFLVDDCYIVKDKNGSSVKHLEAELRWHAGIPRDMGRYMQALDLKLELPVNSVLLLLTQAGVPDPIPGQYRIKRGEGFQCEASFSVVKLWELEAGAVLELGRPSMMPWVPLMKATAAEIRRAGRIVAKDQSLAVQFLTLGKLNPRYNQEELLELLGRRTMLLKDEILEQSPYLQPLLKKVREQGLEQGLEQGAESARKTLLRVLRNLMSSRFTGVPVPSKIERLSTEDLELMVNRLLAAPDNAAARAILRSR